MAITITRAEVKRKCMIPASDTVYDSDIDALISEMQPSIEYTIADEHLNDSGNTKLQATLKLGILEIISGECMHQIDREAGASEDISAGGITLGARKDYGSALSSQGTARLSPYLKVAGQTDVMSVSSTTSDSNRTFTNDSMKGW